MILQVGISPEPFELSDRARERADKIDKNFKGQLWERAKQLALQRGSNTIDESDINNAYKMLLATPSKSTRVILSRVATRIGVFIGGVMFLAGINMVENNTPKLLLIGGGLLLAIICAILEEFLITHQ